MLEIFGLIGFVVVLLVVVNYFVKGDFSKSVEKLNENKIVKKFNSILKEIGKRDLETVKADLIELLDKYKICKEEQYSFKRAQLDKAINEIDKQLGNINTMSTDLVNRARKLKNSQGDARTGARFLYQADIMKDVYQKLQDTRAQLEGQRMELINSIDLFNGKYALKRAEISMMIANVSYVDTVDIKLDNLVEEFQNKAIEMNAAAEVHEQLNHSTDNVAYDEQKYLEMFETL